MPYQNSEIEKLMGKRNFNIAIHKDGVENNDFRAIDTSITIEQFKRMVLNLTNNKKFFLKCNLDNDLKLEDLI